MARIAIQTTQTFYVTYVVEANSDREAWDKLIDADLDAITNEDQTPGDISGSFKDASFEEVY